MLQRDPTMPRLPRPLDPVECRVLGALLEKEQATPEYYPMTINALVAACNQKNNRDPVLGLSEREVDAALRRLFEDVLVWRAEGARSLRWSHNLDQRWRLTPPSKAVMTLLLLRGPQTPGELRGRGQRLYPFDRPAEVEAVLADLAAGEEPLVAELEREPGQKERRWTASGRRRVARPPWRQWRTAARHHHDGPRRSRSSKSASPRSSASSPSSSGGWTTDSGAPPGSQESTLPDRSRPMRRDAISTPQLRAIAGISEWIGQRRRGAARGSLRGFESTRKLAVKGRLGSVEALRVVRSVDSNRRESWQ